MRAGFSCKEASTLSVDMLGDDLAFILKDEPGLVHPFTLDRKTSIRLARTLLRHYGQLPEVTVAQGEYWRAEDGSLYLILDAEHLIEVNDRGQLSGSVRVLAQTSHLLTERWTR